MALKLAAVAAIAAANAVVDLIDAGAAGNLIIYSGAEPATPETAIGAQVPLVNFELPDPAFGAASDTVNGGAATLNAVTPVDAIATGTATFFRILDGNDVVLLQGTVTDTAGNGDLKVSSTSIVDGIEVTIVSLVYAQPKA